MAVRFDAAGDAFTRTTDVINYNAAYTWMAWIYIDSIAGNYGTFFCVGTGSDLVRPVDFLGHTDGGNFVLGANDDANYHNLEGSALSTGTWYHVAVVRSATNAAVAYLNGVSDIVNNSDMTGRTASSRMDLGRSSSANGDALDGRMDRIKAWSTNLSAAEIRAEMWRIESQRFANLYSDAPVFPGATERVRDYSVNVRNWTAGGTLADVAGSPTMSHRASPIVLPFVAAAGGQPTVKRFGGVPYMDVINRHQGGKVW